MRAVSLGTLLFGCASGLLSSLTGGDNTETLILWQVLKNGGNMQTQANMMPLLLSQLYKDDKKVMNSATDGGKL